ncbi:hypothetical protein JHK87_029592 [Glycine soja]|nr:hypothetical protein JHK87_029592 [Glycine soja]
MLDQLNKLWEIDRRKGAHAAIISTHTFAEALAYIEKVAIPHPWSQSKCVDDCSIGYVSVKPECGDYRCKHMLAMQCLRNSYGGFEEGNTNCLKKISLIIFSFLATDKIK